MSAQGVPNGQAAQAALEQALDQVSAFMRQHGSGFDELEVWWRQREAVRWDVSLAGAALAQGPPAAQVVLRGYRRGKLFEAMLQGAAPSLWAQALRQASGRSGAPPGRPPTAQRPPPMTYDPDLPAMLNGRHGLSRLAQAVAANTAHEAERLPGLADVKGHVEYASDRTIVARKRGLVSRLSATLQLQVELNGVYGDEVHQVHAPDSLLPLALLGARTWRSMPRGLIGPAELRPSGGRVVLHPRALEAILRAAMPYTLATTTQADSARVAAPAVSLIDDPGLDGLAGSRAFDDAGCATRRRALIIRGRLADRLSRDTGGAGCEMRGDDGALAPQLSSLLMERGETGFHDLVDSLENTLLVQAVGPVTVHGDGRFETTVRWGLSLQRAQHSRLLAPGAWRLSGRLLPDESGPGCLWDAQVSRELVDTGSAILPYSFMRLHA